MSTETSIFEKKLILAVLALLVTGGMMWTGKIEPTTFENVYVWICGVFILGEASADWAKWFMSGQQTQSSQQIK